MSKYLVSTEGGEFGNADTFTRIEMIPTLVMRVADIFSGLRHLRPAGHEFSYCIQFNPDYKRTVELMLYDIEREGLPDGTVFYEVDGKRVFEMRGFSGGVVYANCFYLITKGKIKI